MPPAKGEVLLAPEAVDAGDVDGLRYREAARRHHVEPRAELVAFVGADAPTPRVGVPRRRFDACREVDVPAEVVLVGDVTQVTENLWLRRVSLRPPPLLFEVGIEAVGVVDALDVAAGAWVAVPVPRATDVVTALEYGRREAEGAEPVEHVEGGEGPTRVTRP